MPIDPMIALKLLKTSARPLLSTARSKVDPNISLARYTDEAENQILWTSWVILAEFVRALRPELNRAQAFDLMTQVAREPEIQPRFVAMMTNVQKSGTPQRIAMLAAAFFGGASSATMRARVDVAVGALFEEDADSLAKIVDHCRAVVEPALVRTPEQAEREVYVLGELADGHLVSYPKTTATVGRASVAALENACCIRRDQRRDGSHCAAWPLSLLPVGEALASALDSVDWRDIAAQADLSEGLMNRPRTNR